ncbi:MAG: adenylosuccinate lyase, partial [Desulfovibrionaceae bacterium]
MIERYTRPAMGAIWTLQNRYAAWLQVELAVCEAWHRLGRIPAAAMGIIRQKAA